LAAYGIISFSTKPDAREQPNNLSLIANIECNPETEYFAILEHI
jgi:hypothetical protein